MLLHSNYFVQSISLQVFEEDFKTGSVSRIVSVKRVEFDVKRNILVDMIVPLVDAEMCTFESSGVRTHLQPIEVRADSLMSCKQFHKIFQSVKVFTVDNSKIQGCKQQCKYHTQ